MKDDAMGAVNQLFESYQQNYQLLISIKEISFANEYKDQQAKIYLLACASYFETKVTDTVLETLETNDCSLTHSFVAKKALARQYHTLFDWKGRNANSFFGLFGGDFRDFMKAKIKGDIELDSAIKNFLELGHLRNQLIHDNYALFRLNLTVEDIQKKFSSAHGFVQKINPLANEYRESLAQIQQAAAGGLDKGDGGIKK